MSFQPKMFKLVRHEDLSGISGTGDVAEGMRFSDGSCTLHWKTDSTSWAIYRSVRELVSIHGHEGRTRLVWID